MSELVPGMCQSFLVLYTFLSLAYIALLALPYRAAVVYYYLVLVAGLFILDALMPYLGAVCTVLDLGESCLGIALKM